MCVCVCVRERVCVVYEKYTYVARNLSIPIAPKPLSVYVYVCVYVCVYISMTLVPSN